MRNIDRHIECSGGVGWRVEESVSAGVIPTPGQVVRGYLGLKFEAGFLALPVSVPRVEWNGARAERSGASRRVGG